MVIDKSGLVGEGFTWCIMILHVLRTWTPYSFNERDSRASLASSEAIVFPVERLVNLFLLRLVASGGYVASLTNIFRHV